MLFEFIADNREQIVNLARAKVAKRPVPRATEEELSTGLPLFLDQLVETLRQEADRTSSPSDDMGHSAAAHGHVLLAKGFTVAQVVHDYGSVCQAVTELAVELEAPITTEEFRSFNLLLDNAIAEAVTEYGRQRDQNTADKEVERLGFLAHEQRNFLNAAMLSYQAVLSGTVAIGGSTGKVLGRSLRGLRDLIDRSLADVRLSAGVATREYVLVAELIEEAEVSAAMDAKERGLHLTVAPAEYGVGIDADRPLIASALSNLLQNAAKFTPHGGHVSLRSRIENGRVLIDVEDECGGLPAGAEETLFRPFEQRGEDKSGLGLGLVISLRGVKANDGDISVRNIPGKGCVFTISLPVVMPKTLTH